MAGTGASGGHNRKSIREHQLRGTVRLSRHAGLGEPVEAPVAAVVKPGRLSAAASVIWDELAPLATEMGTLTAADVSAFSVLCELQATFNAAVAAKGTGASATRLERQTAMVLRPWLAMFGFDPQSRQRLHLTPKPAANALDRFLTRTPTKWPELK